VELVSKMNSRSEVNRTKIVSFQRFMSTGQEWRIRENRLEDFELPSSGQG
jgi:hypothetical protein